jgi:molybdopterin biosynthesis enzyme
MTGTWVRQVGSDISANEIIVSAGQRISSAEIGLLATAGIVKILCHRKPAIGSSKLYKETIS